MERVGPGGVAISAADTTPSIMRQRGRLALTAALWFAPACVLLTALVGSFHYARIQTERRALAERQALAAEVAERTTQDELNAVVEDLRSLLASHAVQTALAEAEKRRYARLAGHFADLLAERPHYDHVCLIAPDGREVARANRGPAGPAPVPPDRLKDKSQRYYFRNATRLGRGQVYVSPLDLNVEQGVVEIPHKPTIRFAARLFDSQGRCHGVLAVNYLADHVLRHLDWMERRLGDGAELMLANEEGYWLRRRDPFLAWGFQLPGRSHLTLAREFPEVWNKMSGDDIGQHHTEQGLFTHRVVRAVAGDHTPPADKAPDLAPPKWTLISRIAPEALAEMRRGHNADLRMTLATLWTLLGAGCWFMAVARERRRVAAEAVSRNERRLRAILDSLQAGVVVFDKKTRRVLQANPMAAQMIGAPVEELTGWRCWDIYQPRGNLTCPCPTPPEGEPEHGDERLLRSATGDLIPVRRNVVSTCLDGRECLIESFIDFTEYHRARAELTRQAQTDSLTGVHNRRGFLEVVRREMRRAVRYGTPLSIMSIDIDHFKRVNDTHGHAAGDRALRALCRACQTQLRDSDAMGRLGGEEFAILFVECGASAALTVAERVREAVRNTAIHLDDDRVIKIAISAGVAQMGEDEPLEEWMARADRALYVAKNLGRNRVMSASPSICAEGRDASVMRDSAVTRL